MLLGIEALDVHDQLVEIPAGFFQMFVGIMAACLDTGIDASFPGCAEQGNSEIVLRQALAAGQRHAAS